jgi:hypothetical protein
MPYSSSGARGAASVVIVSAAKRLEAKNLRGANPGRLPNWVGMLTTQRLKL